VDVEKHCLEFRLEYRIFEILFLSLILFIASLEAATALIAMLNPGKALLRIDSREEALLTALSPGMAYLLHCISKFLSITIIGGKPALKIKFLKMFPLLTFFDSSYRKRKTKNFLAKTLALDSIIALFLIVVLVSMPRYDLPLTLAFSLYVSLLSRRLYLLIVSLLLPPDLKFTDLVDEAFFYGPHIEIGGTSFELFVRLWMVWTTLIFITTWLFFLMIEAGAIIYGVSFTLKIWFLKIFSVEKTNGLFRTEFSPINTFIFSLLLSIAPSLIEMKFRE